MFETLNVCLQRKFIHVLKENLKLKLNNASFFFIFSVLKHFRTHAWKTVFQGISVNFVKFWEDEAEKHSRG